MFSPVIDGQDFKVRNYSGFRGLFHHGTACGVNFKTGFICYVRK